MLLLLCTGVYIGIFTGPAQESLDSKTTRDVAIEKTFIPRISDFSNSGIRRTISRDLISSLRGDQRIREEYEEHELEYSASRLLVTFPPHEESGVNSAANLLYQQGYETEIISPVSLIASWNETSIEIFDENYRIFSRLLPFASIGKDFVNRTAGWTKGETVHDTNDRMGHQWLYENQYDAEGIIIAVIDSGTSFNHEDLYGAHYTNRQEDIDNVDNDGNGFVDDFSGWDFYENDNDPTDEDGHGTAICGIIAADGHNGTGVAGFAPGATILPVRFMDRFGEGYDSDAIKAIEYSRITGADIINASWGRDGESSSSLRTAIESYIQSGGIFITAAGNDGKDIDEQLVSPGSLDLEGMIVVGGVRQYFDYLDPSSNYGKVSVDILAPYTLKTLSRHGSRPYDRSGTSISSAVVSGMMAITARNFPSLTSAEHIDRTLKTSAFVWGPRNRVVCSGTPSYPRIFDDQRPVVPKVTSHQITPDPVHIGEVVTISFSVSGDEYAVVTGEGENGEWMLSRNQLSFAVPIDGKDVFFRVYGLEGSTDYEWIQIRATPSAPYITYSLPEEVALESLTTAFEWPREEEVRGDRFVEMDMGINGFDAGIYSPWEIDFNHPSWAGLIQVVMRNPMGQNVIELRTSWRGKRRISQWSPRYHWQDGKDFLTAGVAGILRFDGESVSEHPYPAGFIRNKYRSSRKSYHDWIILTDYKNTYTTIDGEVWNEQQILPLDRFIVAGKYSRWWILYETPHEKNIWFYDVEQGDLHLLEDKPERPPGPDRILANGNSILICDFLTDSPLVFKGGESWIRSDNVKFDRILTTGMVEGVYVVVTEDPRVDIYSAWLSPDGIEWENHEIESLRGRKLFLLNHRPCFFDGSIFYTFSVDQMAWIKICDFNSEMIYNTDWSIPVENEEGKLFIGGRFIKRIKSPEWIHLSNEGFFVGTENGVYFSSNLEHWSSISTTLPGKLFLDEDLAYLANSENLTILDSGGNKIGTHPGTGSKVENIHFHRNRLFVKDSLSWKIWMPGTQEWSSSFLGDGLTFSGEDGRVRFDGDANWTLLPEKYDHGLPDKEGFRNFKGKSIYVSRSEEGNMERFSFMEDAYPAQSSTYEFFPQANSTSIINWFEDPQLGWFYESEVKNCIVSADHGWLYLEKGRDSLFLYDASLGWLLYDPKLYPILYSYNSRCWLYYLKGSAEPRWFFDYDLMDWVQV